MVPNKCLIKVKKNSRYKYSNPLACPWLPRDLLSFFIYLCKQTVVQILISIFTELQKKGKCFASKETPLNTALFCNHKRKEKTQKEKTQKEKKQSA